MTTKPFNPAYGSNQVVSPAAGSASVTIDSKALSVRLVNSGANICYVRLGEDSATATTADLPVAANSEVIISKSQHANTLAYISAAGTTLNIQTGEDGV